ncbi:ABC transporter ATP-binding protein [Candidatus Roizmanbacteria bacterium]|nr:ABC transporter ATP-binding protein [Candidatus Roizmanbacteria bacterium]
MIKLENLHKEYVIDHDITFVALENISVSIDQGEFTAITGPSGSGKSTLMHIIGLLDRPTRGTVMIENNDISKLNDDQISTLRNEFVGFVFQQFNLINKLTVRENILLPTIYARKKLAFDPLERARYLLDRFGLKDKGDSYPNKISGGQQQRVAIARALMMNPKLILADEPTGNLDTKTGSEIVGLLKELNKSERITVVVVTHESNVAKQARRIIKIKDGTLV